MTKSIQINDGLIHYQFFGQGEPLVFLHGFLGSCEIWNDVILPFKNKYQIVLIDFPGHGKSDLISNTLSIFDMANIISQVLIAEKINKPIVFGHSMGGYIALELSKVIDIYLVLVHSNFWADSAIKKSERTRIIDVVKQNKSLFNKQAIPNLFFKASLDKLKKEVNYCVNIALNTSIEATITSTKAMQNRVDFSKKLNHNKTYIIQGDKDPIISFENMVKNLEIIKFPKEQFFVLKSCGHMGFIEQKESFIRIVKSIINEIKLKK